MEETKSRTIQEKLEVLGKTHCEKRLWCKNENLNPQSLEKTGNILEEVTFLLGLIKRVGTCQEDPKKGLSLKEKQPGQRYSDIHRGKWECQLECWVCRIKWKEVRMEQRKSWDMEDLECQTRKATFNLQSCNGCISVTHWTLTSDNAQATLPSITS